MEKPPESSTGEGPGEGRSRWAIWIAKNWFPLAAFASWLVSAAGSLLAGLTQLSQAVMLVGATLIVASGSWHLIGVRHRQRDRRYTQHRKPRRLLNTDRRFAVRWIGCGFLVAAFAMLDPFIPIVFPLLAAMLVFFTYVNGFAIGTDIAGAESAFEIEAVVTENRQLWESRARRAPRLPGACCVIRMVGHRRPLGEIGLELTAKLLVLACLGLAFAGLALGEALEPSANSPYLGPGSVDRPIDGEAKTPGDARGGGGGSPEDGGSPLGPNVKTYAEACPELPNPIVIEHGLGELFRRAGAIAAGCGGTARRFEGIATVWISEGICGPELRSLGVASAGHRPVLLFGSPARFALKMAEAGELLFVDLKDAGSGEVAAVGTEAGAYLFTRRTPSIEAGNPDATDCTEVGGLARPFARLRPPLGQIWLEYVKDFGWAWPLDEGTNADEVTLVDENDPAEELRAFCRNGLCTMDGRGEYRVADEPAFVTLDDLTPYMPPAAG